MPILDYINRMNQLYGNDTQVAGRYHIPGSYGTQDTYQPYDETPMPNMPDLLREEGIQVGPQVKAPVYNTQQYLQGGRVGFANGRTLKDVIGNYSVSDLRRLGIVQPMFAWGSNEPSIITAENLQTHRDQMEPHPMSDEDWERMLMGLTDQRKLKQIEDSINIYEGRSGYKPGGLVEPGVTHYATTTDAEVIKFYNNQVLKKDSLYNKYKQARYTKIYDKPFEKLTPDEKKNIKKVQQNYKRLLPNLKKAEGLIKVSEASKILGLPESKGTKGLSTRISDVLTRTGARGGQGREFIENVLKPKFGFITLDIGEGKPSMFMKNPENVKDGVKILQDFYLRKGSKFGITPEVLQRVKELHKSPKIINAFLDGDLKQTLKLINAKGWTGSQGSTAMFRLAQLYDGKKFINVDFKLPKNKKVSEGIFNNIAKAPFTNVFHSRGYQIAMDEITQGLGNDYFDKGSMESFKKKVRRIINKQKLGKWQINEMIGVTPTTRTGAHPYSQFINLMEKTFNERQYADFVKQFGNYQIDLQKEIKKGPRGNPSSIIEKFDNYSKNFKELHKMKATDLPTLSLQDPSELYTDKRLRQLSDQGLDLSKHFKKTGYSIGVGDAPTLKEYITNPKETRALISKIGCPGLAAGGRVGFADGKNCFDKGIANIKNKNIKSPAQAKNMLKLAKAGSKSSAVRSILGIYGLAGEAIIEAGIGAYKVLGQNVPADVAWAESYWSYLDPRKYRGELRTRRDLLKEKSPRAAKYIDALEKVEERDKLVRNLKFEEDREAGQIGSPAGWNKKRIDAARNELNQYDEIIRNFYGGTKGLVNTLEKHQAEFENLEAEQAGKFTLQKGVPFFDSNIERRRLKAEEEMMYDQHGAERKLFYDEKGDPYFKYVKDPDAFPYNVRTMEGVGDYLSEITDMKRKDFDEARKLSPEFNQAVISMGLAYDPAAYGTQERFNTGGRVPFVKGKVVKGIDEGKRAFMKWIAGLTGAGIAAGTGILKWGKVAGKGKTAIKAGDHIIQGTPGMPDWLIPLINRVVKEGIDDTAKLATKEREIVHTKQISKGEHVDVYRDLDTGNVRVEYQSKHSEAPIQMEYRAPQVIDEGKHAGKKTDPEFEAVEAEPRWEIHGPDDADIGFDGENIVGKIDDLTTDTSKLKEFGKNKKLTIKEKLEAKKKQDYRKSLEHDSQTQADYLEGKHGPGPEPDTGMDEFGNIVDEYGEIID